MAAGIPSVKLNNGVSIPVLGYGTGTTWMRKKKAGGGDGGIDRTLVESIKSAIKLGYYHLDGAETYQTEAEVGIAIKESGVSRDKLFVTAKVIDNIDDIPNALETSLKKFGLDYVDLYLIHSPFFAKTDEDLQCAWSEMEKLHQAKKARAIGVSNFLQHQLETVLKTAQITPSVNQIEYHPYLQHGSLVPFHQKIGIVTEGYGPLSPATRAKGGPIDGVVSKLAGKYGVSEGVILLRWAIDRGVVTITTSGKESRLEEYLQAMKFQLTEEEVSEIAEIGEKHHFRTFWREKFAEDDRS